MFEETAIDLARMVEETSEETDLETEINIEIAGTTERTPGVHLEANLSTAGLKETAESAEVMEIIAENEARTGSRQDPGGPITT